MERIKNSTSNKSKQEEFRKLAEDVSKCHVCENMVALPHLGIGERLKNDHHGLDTDTPYVNLWNLWQGNIEADIMVIGQDYGQKEDDPDFDRRIGDDSNPTDKNLKTLFQTCFGFDLDSKNAPLFFTNMANCYRQNRTSGEMHDGWLPVCANKFMGRLIRIIRPKIIIVLGQSAFGAMFCMNELPIKCIPNPQGSKKDTFASVLEASYQIQLDNETIDVFPVYHPGAYSQKNRNFELQKQDWKRIADCYHRKNK